jgi:hypothetical protein
MVHLGVNLTPIIVKKQLKLDAFARRIFLDPEVTEDYRLNPSPLKEKELHYFLCDERAFSRKRVELLVERMRKAQTRRSIMEWTKGDA